MQQDLLPFQSSSLAPTRTGPGSELFLNELEYQRDLEFSLGVLDAHRIKLSHLYDKLSSLSNSRTRLLPHQIEATYLVANALRPRFILADEVGLGKTIEAGLIIKELMFRKGYRRVLVAVPAPLTVQWQQEMRSKFNEDFLLLNRKNFYEIAGNWSKHTRIVTSIDFVKNPRYADDILKNRWDIAVFDEAHRLRRDYSKVTHAYAFAEKMSERCEALLLLSATPFRGKLEELYYLVRLVDPHLLGPYHSFLQEYVMNGDTDEQGDNRKLNELREKVTRVLLRRRKVEVGGFTKRHARTVRFDLSPEERAFYDETTEYVRREYNLAMREKNRAVSFIMIVFQKLLDSSTRALLRALEKRKAHIEQKLFGPTARSMVGQNKTDAELRNLFSLEDDDEALDELEGLEGLGEDDDRGRTLKDMRKEIMTLGFLIKLGRAVKSDRKLTKMLDTMERLKKEGHPKFLIFTQFRTTQDYLLENLKDRYRVSVFHGSQNLVQKEEAIQAFREDAEVLICTEAGGEGRNLQFANILINYDLPWSPLKIEQRIGRLHRFGQTRDVFIINFATRDTVAERILEVLERKIKLFEECIGTPDILLGTFEDETDFQNSLMRFVTGGKTREELESEFEAKIKLSESGFRKLGELVTPHCVDFNLTDYYDYTRERRSIENEEIEGVVLKYLRQKSQTRFSLEGAAPRIVGAQGAVPAFASEGPVADYVLCDSQSGTRRPATFRSELALEKDSLDFLAVGHPLVDEALQYFLDHPSRRTVQSLKLPGVRGFYFVFLCHYLGGMSRSELLSCVVDGSRCAMSEEILIAPAQDSAGWRGGSPGSKAIDPRELERAAGRARQTLEPEAAKRAENLKGELHSIFKKEEYKLEISYGKKIRQIEEKLDRMRLRARMQPTVANRALLTRTENELYRARHERELRVHRIRKESGVAVRLELLQVYYSG
jgi:superfamily II DNA or RNA helicase